MLIAAEEVCKNRQGTLKFPEMAFRFSNSLRESCSLRTKIRKMFLPNLFKKNNLKLNPWKVYHFYFCNINKSVYRNLIAFHKNKSIFCQALNSLINITFLSAFLFACCCCCCCFMPIIFVLDFLAWIFRHLSSDACFTVSKFSDFAHFEMHNSFSKSKVFFVLL